MTQLNIENIKALVEVSFVEHAHKVFGENGSIAIRSLLNTVKLFYHELDPESIDWNLTVLCDTEATPTEAALDKHGEPHTCGSVAEAADSIQNSIGYDHIYVEICRDGTLRALMRSKPVPLEELALTAVVYNFENSSEQILIGDFQNFIVKVSPILASNFAEPTNRHLDDALAHYRDRCAEHSKCKILECVWAGVDDPKLVLNNKPEHWMRDSLCQALSLMLRSASVRPEQNTDESMPVDIRIDWFGRKSTSLVEIKWLGRSLAKSRDKDSDTQTYTDYGPARARDGAGQLADYLDREEGSNPARYIVGYLVVFDARRRHVKGPNDYLTIGDATYFRGKDVVYDPDFSSIREDFANPVRFFMEPRKSLCLANTS